MSDSSQAQAKLALAAAIAGHSGDTPSVARMIKSYESAYGAGSLAGPASLPRVAVSRIAATPYSVILSMSQSPQQKSYYCGPAEGYAMLRWTGPSTAHNNGASLSQTNVASPSHMATDENHGTSWASGLFATGLNVWRGNSFYVQTHAPSGATFENAITYDVGSLSMPLAADTVEIVNGAHYNHHPEGETIGHWLAVYGYNTGGANVNFLDSSTPYFTSAKPDFITGTSAFASTYLKNNGIAW